ncbi:Hachiman antiphage defense system protein HamA [Veillonella atypica]|uniref:Hachiman antiphage defense system protein HamA n=1 Tax=Veillonella atypica TaxID=39777 RepID=UPI003AF5618C
MEYNDLIDGIKVLNNDDKKFYIIESLSEELKTLLRKNMSEICFGVNKIEVSDTLFSFQNTIKEFLIRFKPLGVSLTTKQKGYLGELLTHIVLRQEENIEPLSLFFNLEERSFKKGFDLVFLNQSNRNIIIVEVKSGSKRKGQKNLTETAKRLLDDAKDDLIERLNSPDDRNRLWNNALSHADAAINNTNSEKKALQKLLAEQWENSFYKQDLVLVSGVFESITENICVEEINKYYNTIENNASLMALSDKVSIVIIHNDIFRDLYNFFLEVKENG